MISSIASYDYTKQAPAQTASNETATMGKDEFLKLLVAQLQHQDPLNPSDPTEFTAQLSQFSSLEQLFEVNKQLASIVDGNSQGQPLQSLSLLGKDIVIKSGSEFDFSSGPIELGANLEEDAASGMVNIYDKNSLLVASLPLTNLEAGDQFATWDGLDGNGRAVPEGKYSFFVKAKSLTGDDLSTSQRIKARVSGVDLNASENSIRTNAGAVSMSSIDRVFSEG